MLNAEGTAVEVLLKVVVDETEGLLVVMMELDLVGAIELEEVFEAVEEDLVEEIELEEDFELVEEDLVEETELEEVFEDVGEDLVEETELEETELEEVFEIEEVESAGLAT